MRRRGFTLVEILISMIILAILSSSVWYISNDSRKTMELAREVEFLQDVAILQEATVLYLEIEGEIPRSIGDLWHSRSLIGANMSPWKTPYAMRRVKDGRFEFYAKNNGVEVTREKVLLARGLQLSGERKK